MTDVVPAKVIWRAEADGVAHAHVGRLPRTACDRPATSEQFAWPRVSHCPVCLELAPLPEVPSKRRRRPADHMTRRTTAR